MNTRERWSRILLVVGYAAMLVGAVDPLEGSLLILPGGVLVAVGTGLSAAGGPWRAYRWWACGLIAIGVGALFGMSAIGGIGGPSGPSLWWGLLVFPYLIGWCMMILGPGNPRWVPTAGMVIGLWYLTIPVMMVLRTNPSRPFIPAVMVTLGSLGLVLISGGLWRWRHRRLS